MKKQTLYMWIACIAAVGIVFSLLVGYYTEEQKNEYVYEKVDEIVSDKDELEKYGMEAEHLFYWPKMLAIAGGIGVVCLGMVILCIKYTKEQDQRIREMERYCEEILDGNETLDLRDNEEGQFSILKNKVHDITIMLREQNQSLEQNKKEMEQMIADISHQLKTPITSLNMIHDILYMDLPEEKKAEFLDNMQKDLMKIEWLVKAVLNMAKLDSGSLELEKKEEQAAEFSKEIQDHFKAFCEVNGSEILTEQAEGIAVFCDRKWTREAVNNIVKNAIEHGAQQVKLCWESNVLYTKLTIADDGEGIDREELPHIFERFYRTKNSKEDSLGLGLAFAKSIILHQDGEIKVQSKKGVGTTFYIKFYKNLP